MKAIVSAASARSVSSRTTKATGWIRGAGAASASSGSASPDRPKATTRRPAAVSSLSFAAIPGASTSEPLPISTSGAPRTKVPAPAPLPSSDTPDHFHSEEKGTSAETWPASPG